METRILKLKPELKHTLRPGIAEWDGKLVTVESWHELYPTTKTAKLFPNDTKVGFVLEFSADIPESELSYA